MRLKTGFAVLLCVVLLAACGRSDPQAALDAVARDLQAALEAKNTGEVLALLHPDFQAQTPQDDREWAKRTMTLMFMRYKNIKVIALRQSNRIDSKVPSRGYTDAEIALTGAEGLIPDSARHYRLHLEWRLQDKKWLLIGLQWE